MSAFLVYLAWIVWRDSQSEEAVWVGAAILLVAVFVVALATWRLRTGRTPLIVERSGRVYYGEKELCSPGQVRTVPLVPSSGDSDYDVCLELDGGTRRLVPGFAYGPRESALAFAQELGADSGVRVEQDA